MRWISRLILAFIIIPVMAMASLIDDKEGMLVNIQDEIRQINARLLSSERQQAELMTLLQKSEKAMSEWQQHLRQTAASLLKAESALKEAQEEEIRLNTYFKTHQAELKNLLTARYKMKAETPIQLLLSNPDLAQTERLLHYFKEYFEVSQANLDELRQKLVALKETKLVIVREKDRLKNLQQAQTNNLKRLRQENRKRQIILSALNDAIHSDEMRVRRLKEDESALAALLIRLQDSNKVPDPDFPFQKLKGALPWPTIGQVISAQEAFGKEVIHRNGVFIEAAEEQPVHAVHAGQIVFADWMRGYGLLVILDHQDGYFSLYAHNDALYQSVGSWVKSNEVIAKVGKSGGHEKIGLYFELRKNSKPLAVKDWLQG